MKCASCFLCFPVDKLTAFYTMKIFSFQRRLLFPKLHNLDRPKPLRSNILLSRVNLPLRRSGGSGTFGGGRGAGGFL